jgi:DNA repair exonuclease SbcCD ATPase subunit
MSKQGEKSQGTPDRASSGAEKVATAPAGADAGNIDKIRDILFGNQVRDFDRRFSQFEQHLSEITSDLRSDVFKRLDALEAYFKAELSAEKDRLRTEAAQRLEAEKHLSESIKEVSALFERQVKVLEEKTAEHLSELRQQLLEQSKHLAEDLQARHERTTEAIASSARRLEEAKLDRSMLSECLMDLAMRISSLQVSESELRPSH